MLEHCLLGDGEEVGAGGHGAECGGFAAGLAV